MEYVIIRTESAGVFAGELEFKSADFTHVVLRNSRRVWEWHGANTLSELAIKGTLLPNKCKVPCAVDKHELPEVIEIIYCSKEGEESIKNIPVWSAVDNVVVNENEEEEDV